MDNCKKRKHDIDEPTPERLITTIDILDSYPYLSKQLQAAAALRNYNIESDVIRVLNMRGNLYELIGNIFKALVERYFSQDLELKVKFTQNAASYSFERKGLAESIEWNDERHRQPFMIRRNSTPILFYRQDTGRIENDRSERDKVFAETEHEYEKWMTENPHPYTNTDMPPIMSLNILSDELLEFLDRVQTIVNEQGYNLDANIRSDEDEDEDDQMVVILSNGYFDILEL